MDGDTGINGWAQFSRLNLAYLAELYDRYLANPASVDPATRAFFEMWGPPPSAAQGVVEGRAATGLAVEEGRLCGAMTLAMAVRMYGHQAARLDPLGSEPPGDRALLPDSHGLREEELADLPASVVGGPLARGASSALEAFRALRRVYQGSMGLEFEHISSAEERDWWTESVESGRYASPADPIDERRLLERLTLVEAFERFLQSAFPAQTRFSLEGLDMLVPMLDELIGAAAASEAKSVVMGMAHRGRLNVLAHVLGKPYEQILAEFRGAYERPESPIGGTDLGWTGDVKYHLGAGKAVRGSQEGVMLVSMAPNPSHLEFIDPVVEGMTRAASEDRDETGPARVNENTALAVLIHGEAAFVGEGIVPETLNLSRLPGYRSGGTIHIIENNQLGFTTPPELERSTLFASDLAKGFEVPVVHVNADDPEACLTAVRLSHAYLEQFHKDVLIDLIGYRRFGHNEGDEPTFTQPTLYRIISQHPTVRDLWAREMERRGQVTLEESRTLLQAAIERLNELRRTLPDEGLSDGGEEGSRAGLEAGGNSGSSGHPGAAAEIRTSVPAGTLRGLNDQLLALPTGFHLHPKLEPLFAKRRSALAPEGPVDRKQIEWSHAEVLAFASLLAEGTPVRLTGQDTTRGTFSQRHLLLHDVETDDSYCPLQHLPAGRAAFDLWDSPLAENATLGFEFGYSLQARESLVLWEAQYGDFANAAQVIIDSFVTSARSKWGILDSLVLLLPHGHEGQGPDHSCAHLERFLQMAAEDNLRIANCTTAAQYFHILRRQSGLLLVDPRPLVLVTPKSLLRHPLVASSLDDLTVGRFQPVIDDDKAMKDPGSIRRLILCSGKLYLELVTARSGTSADRKRVLAAIVRVEELYPFPAEEIGKVVGRYPSLQEVVWAQEEPRNMGAWTYVAPRLRDLLGDRLPLLYVGRPNRASPAEGAYEWHLLEQRRVVEDALQGQAPA